MPNSRDFAKYQNWSKPSMTSKTALTTMLLQLVLLSALTGCAASIKSVKGLNVPHPDASLMTPIPRAVPLPDRELTQSEAEKGWIRDRQTLLVCRSAHEGLVTWTTEVLAYLEGVRK